MIQVRILAPPILQFPIEQFIRCLVPKACRVIDDLSCSQHVVNALSLDSILPANDGFKIKLNDQFSRLPGYIIYEQQRGFRLCFIQ